MSLPDGPRPRRPGPPDGEPLVFAADEQSDVAVDLDRLVELAQDVLADRKVKGDCELAITFVDAVAIAELNQQFLGEDGPTDVLAFPIEDDDDVLVGRSPDGSTSGPDREPPSDVPLLLGDVVICPAVAARNAPTHAGTFEDEVALLVVHGVLHVLGHDHADEGETAAMQARERELLDRYHRSGA